jgi:transcription antitermination factor NusA-like protein
MPYTVTSDTVGLAIGPVSETANDVHEALSKHIKCIKRGWSMFQLKPKRGGESTATSC